MYSDYYGQAIYNYLVNYIYPILSTISSNIATFNNNFNKFVTGDFTVMSTRVEHILFWVCLLVFLYISYKFLRIRSRTL